MTDAPIPKEQLLRKLLKMTTSDTDGEALVAIRKANELMRSAGWDWDKLLDAKIKIIESPFAKVATVASNRREFVAPPPRPTTDPGAGMMWELNSYSQVWEAVADPAYRRRRPPMPATPPGYGKQWQWNSFRDDWQAVPIPQPSTVRASRSASTNFGGGKPHGMTKPNIYANSCYCCGDQVAVKVGWVFNPSSEFGIGPNKWEVMCEPCNQRGATVPPSKARPTGKPAGAPAMGSVNLGSL